jgi:hypothetical protein
MVIIQQPSHLWTMRSSVFVACIPQFYQVKAVPYDEGQEAAGLNTRFSWG